MHLYFALNINDRGEIAGLGSLPNGETHAFLLIPCGEGDEGCEGESSTDVTGNNPTLATQPPATLTPASRMPTGILDRLSRWGQRYRIPGRRNGPTN
jgi:hypothetical protein